MLVKVGDVVKVKNSNTLGIIVTEKRKMFMVGWVLDVLVDGVIKRVIEENLEVVSESC